MKTPSTAVLRLASSLAIASGLAAIPSIASADEVRPLRRGDVILADVVGVRTGGIGYLNMMSQYGGGPAFSGLVGYGYWGSKSGTEGQEYDSERQVFSVNPSVDVVVSGQWTIGVSAGFAKMDQLERYYLSGAVGYVQQSGMAFGVAPRVGYVHSIGHGFSLWPRVGLVYSAGKSSVESNIAIPLNTQYSKSQTIGGGVDLGVMFRPVSYLYLAATPEMTVGYASSESGPPLSGSGSSGFGVRFGASVSMGFVL